MRLRWTIAGLLMASSMSPGQAGGGKAPARLAASWTLLSVAVTGSQRFTPQEISAASGLQVGQMVSEEDFKKAAERLGETGMFGEASYSFQFSAAGAKLQLQVSDQPQLVPARFDNLVWFSDQDLIAKLRERVPLFRGLLPLGGALTDQVSEALQALLIERGVQGQADYIREAPVNQPIKDIVFSVKAHDIHIHGISFSGASPSELPSLEASARTLQGMDYSRSMVLVNERLTFLPIYLQKGYLKASFGTPEPRILQDGGQETTVDVSVPVVPGEQYKLTGIEWSGNTSFTAEQLASLIQLQTGHPANAILLGEDLRQVKKLYGTQGRMAAGFEVIPEMDDARSEVRYEIKVHEGDVYHMGELEIRGLDSRLTSLMNVRWKLHEGDVYDSSYIQSFLRETARELPQDVRWKTTIHETPDDTSKTVDVSINYENNAGQ